ncbi:recombinase family protein [Rhodococcus sp. NPDC056960]|uniref:recombinase family protein n=1 Tax=Rhodococcus sp. NPDC056960 TaxID=3345982 RepID=UPI003624F1C2
MDALRRAGVATADIHVDHAGGAKASRPQLDLVLQLLREGDVLVITRLDRLGRSMLHLITLGTDLRTRTDDIRDELAAARSQTEASRERVEVLRAEPADARGRATS